MNRNNLMRLSFLALFISLTASFFMPVIVSADMASPNMTAINETRIWRNVITTNDTLVVSRYNMQYNPIPAVSIDNAFQFQLYNAANDTEIGVVAPYNYQNSGYEQGVVSWYFYANTGPAWGEKCWIHIQGIAPSFNNTLIYSSEIQLPSYSSYNSTTEVKADIAVKIIQMAKTVGMSWNTTQALTEEQDSGETKLSLLGEAYFKAAIPGIQAMAPALFVMEINPPDDRAADVTWPTSTASNYTAKVNGTTLGNDIKGLGDLFGTGLNIMLLIPVLIACVVMIIIGAVQGKEGSGTSGMLSGLINASVIITATSWGGWFPPIVGLGLIPFGCAVFIFFQLMFKNG